MLLQTFQRLPTVRDDPSKNLRWYVELGRSGPSGILTDMEKHRRRLRQHVAGKPRALRTGLPTYGAKASRRVEA